MFLEWWSIALGVLAILIAGVVTGYQTYASKTKGAPVIAIVGYAALTVFSLAVFVWYIYGNNYYKGVVEEYDGEHVILRSGAEYVLVVEPGNFSNLQVGDEVRVHYHRTEELNEEGEGHWQVVAILNRDD